MSGLATSDAATMSSIVYESGFSAERPISNVTPRRTTGVFASVKRIGHPAASTRVPAAVPGHLSLVSSMPSPSVSDARWQPAVSTSVPAGVLGHLSRPSGTPSLSPSTGQPVVSTVAPGGRHDVAGPVTAREPGTGRVDSASFDSEGDPVAEEQAVPDRPMQRVVVEAVAGTIAELDSGIAAENIEEVVRVPGVEYQAAAPQRHRRVDAARPGRRLLGAEFELEPDVGTEEIAEPAATADLFVQLEGVIIARVRAEPAD